jgi:hypothetical protein
MKYHIVGLYYQNDGFATVSPKKLGNHQLSRIGDLV